MGKHRFPIKLVPTLDWVDFGNDGLFNMQTFILFTMAESCT